MYFLIGLVLVGAVLLVLNAIYIRTPYYQNQVRPIKKFQDGLPDNLDIMNTGSNYAYFAIDWTIVNVAGFSLASGAQSLAWDERLWKKYHSHVKRDGIALFVLADLVFLLSEYPSAKSDRRYYFFMKPEEIPRYTWWRAVCYRYLPILENWRNVIRCVYHRGEPFVEQTLSLAYTERASDARITGWKREFGLPDLQHRESASHLQGILLQNMALLRRMVDETRALGIYPVLMIPPISAVLNRKVSSEFVDAVLYHPLRKQFSDVPLLDYMHDERFQDYRLYQNGDFMNAEGRKVFMPVLWHDIQNCIGKKMYESEKNRCYSFVYPDTHDNSD